MSGGVKVKIQPVSKILQTRGLNPGGDVQVYIDSTVVRLSDPYVSFDSGMLRNSGNTQTDYGSGEVEYKTPYAAKQYYEGCAEGTSHTGGLRGRLWFERMKADHLEEILRGARRRAGVK